MSERKTLAEIDAATEPVSLAALLDQTKAFVCRFVVIGDAEADVVALWNAHTYVFECAYATPYLHPHSPEPGSGKTTLLRVLRVTAHNPVLGGNMTEAVLFRLIEELKPTLLYDEIDTVFGKKNDDGARGIQNVLNNGYQRNMPAWRCHPRTHEPEAFDAYCPKATTGLRELPDTLAHRSIPIRMKPPLPSDTYEDFDPEEIEEEAEALRVHLAAWAGTAADALSDKARKPEKLPELDSRGNEIWRILLRIADLAGGDWPERARAAAIELSGGAGARRDASGNVQLLAHIRDLFASERTTCADLVEALNASDELPYGGWNDGRGMTTRELGRKLAPFGIYSKPIRIDGARRGNGYERAQFQDAWLRYLRDGVPVSTDPVPVSVPVPAEPVFGSTMRVVPVVPVSGGGVREVAPEGPTDDEIEPLFRQLRPYAASSIPLEVMREIVAEERGGGA